MASGPLQTSPLVATGSVSGNTTTFSSTNASLNQSRLLTSDSNPDELGKLQSLALKPGVGNPGFQSSGTTGIQFPGIIMHETQSKSLAVHMYPNLDSARVENMGRDPAIFRIRAIFTNHIWPGPNETWTPGLLFPNTFIAVYNLLLDNNNITFQHPIIGDITCQVHSWTYELNPKLARDGAFMDIEIIETIGDNSPLSKQIAPPPGSGLKQAANELDTAIDSVPPQFNPPNVTLSQYFSQIASLIDQATSFPNNVVNAVNNQIINPILNGGATVAADLINAAPNFIQNLNAAIQATKNTVLNSPTVNASQNFRTTFGLPQNTFYPPIQKPVITFGQSKSALSSQNTQPSYNPSTYQAMQSIVHLNSTPSQNAFQLMNKTMRALVDLQQHYIDQNNSVCAPVIESIRTMLLQVQQTQSALSLNTNNQTIKVFNYVTLVPMTWMQLSRKLNNTIDDLMGLNQGQITDLWVPAFTTINYFQA